MTSDNITVIMKPTNQCNLRCKYCYHADNGYDKEKMTDQVLEKAIAVTAPFFKRVEYNWHGGERLSTHFERSEIPGLIIIIIFLQ